NLREKVCARILSGVRPADVRVLLTSCLRGVVHAPDCLRSRAIVRELVKQLMQADADEEHRERMRKILKTRNYPKILKTRNYPDEDDDDPIDADPMRF